MSDTLTENRPHLIPGLLAALMLFGSLGQWPYGYYTLLRFVVCGVGAYAAFVMQGWAKTGLAWLFGFIAVLFNPLVPVHLYRELWQPIDALCGIIFLLVALAVKEPSSRNKT
jgi:TM2 domain-containing membrane protein YozV